MMYRKFIIPLCFLLLLASHSCAKAEEPQKPNILFLLADDLGYGELGCYGQEMIETPVIDQLASDGMRFTQFYAGNCVCAPSRAVLMTGKQSVENTVRGNYGHFSDDRWMRISLKKEDVTLGEMLGDNGYQTAFFGKWHLDHPNDVSTWAYNRGFDYAVQEQWSSRNGGKIFTKHMEWINGMSDSIYYDDHKWNCHDEFRTELALKHLDKIEKDKPFFLFMSYRAPHAEESYINNKELYADKGWPKRERIHAAKITMLDQQIGKMLQKLEEMGELDNTLVILTSDNGPHSEGGHNYEFFNSNGEMKGYKRDLYEGGIRIPFMAYWKGEILAGSTSDYIVGFQDIMPTLASVINIETPAQSNGISILPLLKGENQEKHSFLNWEFYLSGSGKANGGFRQAVRKGKWKAVRYGIMTKVELYDLEKDRQETTNMADQFPEVVKEMSILLEANRKETDGFPYGGQIQN